MYSSLTAGHQAVKFHFFDGDLKEKHSLLSNNRISINFDGGDLTSDGGMLLFDEFVKAVGIHGLIKKNFHTNDRALFRLHTDSDNLQQVILQAIAGYNQDDDADELSLDPMLCSVLGKSKLASQPTLSRFFSRMDQSTLRQLKDINRQLLEKAYALDPPRDFLLDVDSTLLGTSGHQENASFNYHYQDVGYHPLVCYDSNTGDNLGFMLRSGKDYSSKNSGKFITPILENLRSRYPSLKIRLRGDSGFATPEMYDACEANNAEYAIRLKENPILRELVTEDESRLYFLQLYDSISYQVIYGGFMYQAKSWSSPRRVVYKVEKPENSLIHNYTFVVTNRTEDPETLVEFYCDRGSMENLIKETKSGFGLGCVSSHSFVVNENRAMIRILVYNLFNCFRRLALCTSMRTYRIDTIRIKMLKIAARLIRSARYMTFRFCGSFPYKEEFLETMDNIRKIQLLQAAT